MILTFFERIRVSVMAAVVERPQPEEGPLCLRSLSTRAFFFDKSRSRSDGTRNGSNKRPPPPPPQGAGRPPKLLDRLGQRLLLVYLFLWTAAFGAVTMRLNHNTDNGGGEPTTKDDVPCRVIVESHFDYHYEILESVARRFPLPFETFNCNASKPVVVDFSLFDNRWPDRVPWYNGKKPDFLNQTEFWGWKLYYQDQLQYTTVDRVVDDKVIYYNNLIKWADYNEGLPLQAVIDITCDGKTRFERKYARKQRLYCVLHRRYPTLDNGNPAYAALKNRSCWLTPMHDAGNCFFIPSDLPVFDNHSTTTTTTTTTTRANSTIIKDPHKIHVCIGGGKRNQTELVELVAQTPYVESYNIQMTISGRKLGWAARYRTEQLGLTDRVAFRMEKDYAAYHSFVASCDIIVPGYEPETHPAYFPHGSKKLSGTVGQLIAYRIAAVMHPAFEAIYHDYWTAPVETYDVESTFESKLAALNRLLNRMAKEKGMI